MNTRTLLSTLFLLAGIMQGFAQAPANDDCSGAVDVSTTPYGTACSASVSGTTLNATLSGLAPSCALSTLDDDVWYSFVANTASVVFRYSNVVNDATGTTASLSFLLYEGPGCPGSTTNLLCSVVNPSGSGYRIIGQLVPGTRYYLRIWSTSAGVAINFNFCIQDVPAAPANDECLNATVVSTEPPGANCTGNIHATTAGATPSTADAACGGSSVNDDIWYAFTANTSAVRLRVSNAVSAVSTGTVGVGYALYAYSNNCLTTTTPLSCSNNIGFGGETISMAGLTPGNTYYLRMFSTGSNNYMNFDFCIEDLIVAPNDECTGATPIAVSPFGANCAATLRTSTAGGTHSLPDPFCTSTFTDDDIWHKFTATSASVIVRVSNAVVNETGANAQVGFAMYEGACPATSATMVCNNLLSSGTGLQIINGLLPGTEYYLRFWSTLTGGNTVSFDVCVQEVLPITNDECANATPVATMPAGTVCTGGTHVSTVGATRSVPDLSCGSDNNDDDVWFTFTPNESAIRINFSNAVQSAIPSGISAVGYALYAGNCPLGTDAVNCNVNMGNGSGSTLIGGLAPGQPYYIRFFSQSANSYIDFDFCIVDADLPVNDECANAVNLPVGNGFCTTPAVGDLHNATTSAGFGTPACSNSLITEDVWFKTTVPASGNVVIQTSAIDNVAIEDLVMEAYAGDCDNLSLITCNDNGNETSFPSDLHARISLSGRTPGEVIYLRVLKKFALEYSRFGICAWDSSVVLTVSAGGNCVSGQPVTINAAQGNNYIWTPVFDQSGNIIAEIFANGSDLHTVTSSVFVNTSGVVRRASNYYLDRNITLQPAVNGPAKIRIYFRHSEWQALLAAEPTIAGLHALKISKTSTGCLPAFSGIPVTIQPDSIGSYGADHFLQFSVGSFSSFYIDGGVTALPLEFVSFEARQEVGLAHLDWAVVKDETIEQFVIQRSQDGSSFVDVGYKHVSDIASEMNGNWHYTFADHSPAPAVQFYRIKMRSVNGHEVYSRIVPLNNGAAAGGKAMAYPNPASRFVVVKLPTAASAVDCTVHTVTGAIVKRYPNRQASNGVCVLDIGTLTPGIYFLHVTEGRTIYRFKVMKQ